MPPTDPSEARSIAAVDLGSNSFHMVIGQIKDGKLVIIDRLKEMVQLASGLDGKKRLNAAVEQRALACLERFGQRLRSLSADDVRIVGTNTLRCMAKAEIFLEKAESTLGHSVNIISGIEEARLIYQGVTQSLSNRDERRLVIDIGGGSTEFIVGEKEAPRHLESLYMGCVSFTRSYFHDGRITPARLNQAKIAALLELEPHETKLKRLGWEHAIGASGTIRAIDNVIRSNGWGDRITRQGIRQIEQALSTCRHVERIKLPGLDEERRNVFPGGVMILAACFELLDIEYMSVSDGAVREGLLFDLQGRLNRRDLRENTITDLQQRYHTDTQHAQRIKQCALKLLQLSAPHNEAAAQLLGWGALLHEIGLDIAHSQFHKHGAYIIEHADLPGFSLQEQRALALLIRAHRRKPPLSLIKALPKSCAAATTHLIIILRLAALLNRSRHEQAVPLRAFHLNGQTLTLRLGEDWLASHPLTGADLKEEARFLKRMTYRLEYA